MDLLLYIFVQIFTQLSNWHMIFIIHVLNLWLFYNHRSFSLPHENTNIPTIDLTCSRWDHNCLIHIIPMIIEELNNNFNSCHTCIVGLSTSTISGQGMCNFLYKIIINIIISTAWEFWDMTPQCMQFMDNIFFRTDRQ